MNIRSESECSKKCRWFQLIDEFMSDRTHVVSHAHASATNPDALKFTSASVTNIMKHNANESTSKSPEPKRKEDIFLERFIGKIEENNKSIIDYSKRSDDMKMTLLMNMLQTMQKLVEKL